MPTSRTKRWGILLILASILGILCILLLHRAPYVPKPRGYHRISLPGHEYTPLLGKLPYTFAVSKHAVITDHPAPKGEKYWIDIYYPAFDATIQLTYKPVHNNPKLLRSYMNDAYKLTMKHQIKASAIEESILKTPQGHTIVIATLSGQVPSPCQFHTINHTKHFLRGALYFNTASQNDFLAPVIDFIQTDIIHMLNTLQWRDEGL